MDYWTFVDMYTVPKHNVYIPTRINIMKKLDVLDHEKDDVAY